MEKCKDRFSKAGLPKELLQELALQKGKVVNDDQIFMFNIIKSYGGEASINEILVGFWKDHKVIAKRRNIVLLAAKSMRQGYIESITKYTGNYRLTDLEY